MEWLWLLTACYILSKVLSVVGSVKENQALKLAGMFGILACLVWVLLLLAQV